MTALSTLMPCISAGAMVTPIPNFFVPTHTRHVKCPAPAANALSTCDQSTLCSSLYHEPVMNFVGS